MDYESLSQQFWVYNNPLQEAERLIDLHEEIVHSLGEADPRILNNAKHILQPYSDLEEHDDQVEPHCLMARIHLLQRDDESARRHINTAMRADPTSEEALSLMIAASRKNNPAPSLRSNGFTLLKKYRAGNDLEDLDRALMLAHLALKHDTKNEVDATYYLIASVHDARTQYNKGLDYLDVALAHNPDHASSLKLKAKFEQKLGGGDNDVHASRRGEMPYIPSPAGSPIREFMDEFQEIHNWHLSGPRFV